MNRLKHIGILLSFVGLCYLSVVQTACSSDKGSGKEEGVLEFDTKGVDEKHPLYGFVPSSAVLKFKGDRYIVEMSTMGMFNTSVIGDIKSQTIAQTIKFMNIKQACIENAQDLMAENEAYALKIEETQETKEIVGLKAYKLKVTKVHEPNVTFDAWYTKDLGMENCNALNPYAKIKGVLLDYRIKKMGMEMHFEAKSYQHIEVPDNSFDIPAAMKIVSKEEMEKFFDDLQ